MRDAARRIIRRVGVETGGSNIQFAVNPAERPDDRHRDEPARVAVVGARVEGDRASRSRRSPRSSRSAITSTRSRTTSRALTPASFEPTIDYVVVKIPRWNFEKFPQADRTLTTQMKSVGEAMAIGRTFKEAFMKGVRSLELGRSGLLFAPRATTRLDDEDDDGAAQAAGGAERPADVGAVPRARARLDGRADPRADEDRSVVPARSSPRSSSCAQAAALRRARRARRAELLRDAEARRLRRRASSRWLRRRDEDAVRERRAARDGSSRSTSASTPAPPSSSRSRRTCTARYEHDVRGEPERRGRRSSSSAAGRTASARASSSTTAAVTPPSRCARKASRR